MAEPLLNRDDLDTLADGAGEADDPAAVAARLVDAVEAGRIADPADAGYAYLLAAEVHEEADDLEQALALVDRALAGGRAGGLAAGHDLNRLRTCRERLLLQLGRDGSGDAPDPYQDDPYSDDEPDLSDVYLDDEPGGSDAVLLVWPQDAYEQVELRWPELLEPTGAESWEEYRRYCQVLITDWCDRARASLWLVTGDAAEFEEWLAEQGADPFGANLVALARGYGDHLADRGDPVELPLADRDPCWCGSGDSYAGCCRSLSP